ncbi:hypothetical protein J5X84_19490 [Streptosporangiaceae bacterium NEAU-GS5]|nr:hypothetical protein [Streptosporangiaceae bacterium NEAU-GS5]
MAKGTATALLSGVLGGALLIAGTAGATMAAPPKVEPPEVKPLQVILADKPVPVTFTVKSDGVNVTLHLQSEEKPSFTRDLTGTQSGDTWTFHTMVKLRDPLGFWSVTPTATGADNSTTVGRASSLSVIAPTRFLPFTAHPRVVRKGHPVFAFGRLQAKIRGRWQGIAGQKVDIRIFDEIKSVTTNRRGFFAGSVKASGTSQIDASFQAAGHFQGALSGFSVGPIVITVIDHPKK